MELLQAKTFIGKTCSIWWRERSGAERHVVSRVHDATFVPLYGGYLITDVDDIRLDRIISVALVEGPILVKDSAPASAPGLTLSALSAAYRHNLEKVAA